MWPKPWHCCRRHGHATRPLGTVLSKGMGVAQAWAVRADGDVGLVAQWLRAARADVAVREEALRYAIGISVLQVFWLALLWAPAGLWIYGWLILIPLELLVQMLAERADNRRWHPHHISERYGLLTIIVIGESVLACTVAIQSAVDHAIGASHVTDLQVALALAIPISLYLLSVWFVQIRPQPDEVVCGRIFVVAAGLVLLSVLTPFRSWRWRSSSFRPPHSL